MQCMLGHISKWPLFVLLQILVFPIVPNAFTFVMRELSVSNPPMSFAIVYTTRCVCLTIRHQTSLHFHFMPDEVVVIIWVSPLKSYH